METIGSSLIDPLNPKPFREAFKEGLMETIGSATTSRQMT